MASDVQERGRARRYLWHSLGGMALGLGLCWALIRHVKLSPEIVAGLLARFDILPALGAMLVTWLLVETAVRKWALLDVRLDARPEQPHDFYRRHVIWQSALAQILPGSIAVVAGRALVTHRDEARSWRRGARSGFVDQAGEFLVIVAFLPATLWQLQAQASWPIWLFLGTATTIILGATGRRFWPRYCSPALLAWSFLRVMLLGLRLVLGAMAFHLPISAASICYAMPLATLTALLPVTPANLGLAEWGWTYALGLWQVDAAVAALYALSFRLLVLAMQAALLPLLAMPSPRG